jgi:seryl-tRNA synthetase
MSTILGTETEQEFLRDLVRWGHFIPSGEAGIYGRGEIFEDVRKRFEAMVSSIAEPDGPERLRFPPLIPKSTLEKAGYLHSFPHLCGSVFSFYGSEAEAFDLTEKADRGDNWGQHLSMTGVVLVPAACYPAYPAIARRGRLPEGGVTLDLGGSYVYRNEPSGDPARLQMFHQHEMVRIGEMEEVLDWREIWMNRACRIFEAVGLNASLETASDPFFGRGGKLLAKAQREQSLKFEVTVPIASSNRTAVSSFNFHQQHFGSAFGIQLHHGGVASTACLGFGLERITLALFKAHGMDTSDWPAAVRENLWPEAVLVAEHA